MKSALDLSMRLPLLARHLSLGRVANAWRLRRPRHGTGGYSPLDEPSRQPGRAQPAPLIEVIGNLPVTLLLPPMILEMVLALCSRAVVMDLAGVWADGETRRLFSDRKLMEGAWLEVPLSLRTAVVG